MLPTSHNCIVREPGEDDDYVLALADLERLQPSELTVITSWLEKQVAEMSRLAASPVSSIATVCAVMLQYCTQYTHIVILLTGVK